MILSSPNLKKHLNKVENSFSIVSHLKYSYVYISYI